MTSASFAWASWARAPSSASQSPLETAGFLLAQKATDHLSCNKSCNRTGSTRGLIPSEFQPRQARRRYVGGPSGREAAEAALYDLRHSFGTTAANAARSGRELMAWMDYRRRLATSTIASVATKRRDGGGVRLRDAR